jgi:hypothetical protein
MAVNEKLNEKSRILHFRKTAYVPKSSVTLVSVKLLKDEKALWNMHIDTVDVKGTPIFELEEHFGLYIIEYISSGHVGAYANFVGSRGGNTNAVSKGISWKFHLRLGHCQSEVINQLAKSGFIELVNGEGAPKTVQCETCATAKMHSLIFKSSSFKATKSFERLHFDLIILNKAFDDITCIAHFQDEFTFYHWVFSLSNHKQETLLRIVKHVINLCDRLGFEIKLCVQVIRMNQEASFGTVIQDFVKGQGIDFEWSAKETKKQNETAERMSSLLTQKARCIRIAVNLLENLYPECYLAVMHLLNRTLIKNLN